jgi:hypothetical protein
MRKHSKSIALIGGTLVIGALIPSLTSAAVPLRFPTRGDALPADHYINTAGHPNDSKAVDYGRLRWNGVDNWSHFEAGAEDVLTPYTLEENTTFGTPLYAPEDGYVVACFRLTPDGDDPEAHACTAVDTCSTEDVCCPDTIFHSGNFLLIMAEDESHAVRFSHFEYDTIPEELCPNEYTDADVDTWTGDNDYSNNTRMFIVNSGVYPTVLKGEYLGNIGHSGASDIPHGHVQALALTLNGDVPVDNSTLEIEWYEGFYQSRTPGVAPSTTWNAMNGHVVVNNTSIIIMPDPIGIEREDYDYNHDASDLNLTTHADGGVMAYMDGSNGLDIRSFDIDSAGEATLQSLVNEGTVVDVSVARPNTTRSVIVSIRGTNDNLKLIPYAVTTGGTITRQVGKEVTEGDIGFVDSIKSPAHNGVTLAIENSSGNLQVIDYHVDTSLNTTRDLGGDGTGGAIQAVEMTGVTLNFTGVVTAELIQSTGVVKLRSFEVAGSGGVSNADTYTTFLTATELDIDTVGAAYGFAEYVVTSVRLSNGNLRLDSWSVDAEGDITWEETASAGAVDTVDGAALGLGDYLTSVKDSNDDLRLISWMVMDDGQLRRNGTQVVGAVTDALSMHSVASSGHIVTLVSDDTADLRLLSFDENFALGI